MDLRYFSKGYSNFNSLQISLDSKFFDFIIEPYTKIDKFYRTEDISRENIFQNLNDKQLDKNEIKRDYSLRNFLIFPNYKGFGIGYHLGNRWWGPGIHSSLMMSTNSWPLSSYIFGTMKEIRFGKFGFMFLYSFSEILDGKKTIPNYHTALNGKISWHGPIILSGGFSRYYLSGGEKTAYGKVWNASDAQLLVFEGLLTSNLINKEYTIAGHDKWDQTISCYFSIISPIKKFKIYAEFGFNDNRMYLADFISQPDHTLATVLGFRDYGFQNNNNFLYGFEWTNLMITYTIRHRGSNGTPAWYGRDNYDYSSYNGRRWAAHSGSDSDDWLLYFGYYNDKILIMPSFNYERHGIVSKRPAEVKFELRLDLRYKHEDVWFGIYYEKQKEMFLGFPDYFYEDRFGNPVDSSSGFFAKSRTTGTIILSINKSVNF